MYDLRTMLKGILREWRGSSAIDLPSGRHRLAWGARHARRHRSDDYDMLYRLASERSCVFDVGAKVGMTAMCMAGAMTDGVVYAFEAAEASCLVLERNTALNGFNGRIVTVNAMVGKSSGDLCRYYWGLVSGRAGMVMAPPKGGTPLWKPTLALDDFMQQNGLQPELVKIDVEGAELQVLDGMQAIMRGYSPDIALELHAWPGMPAALNVEQILALLEPLGYRMFWLDQRQILDDPGALAGMDVPGRTVESRARFLLLPQGRPVPAWL